VYDKSYVRTVSDLSSTLEVIIAYLIQTLSDLVILRLARKLCSRAMPYMQHHVGAMHKAINFKWPLDDAVYKAMPYMQHCSIALEHSFLESLRMTRSNKAWVRYAIITSRVLCTECNPRSNLHISHPDLIGSGCS